MNIIKDVLSWALIFGYIWVPSSGVFGATSLRLEPLGISYTTNSPASTPLEGGLSTNSIYTGTFGQWSTASGSAWGRSAVGWLRLKAQGSSEAQSPIGSWSGQGLVTTEAYWDDSVTVNGGAPLHGQPGYLTGTIVIEGTLGLAGGDLANQSGAYFFINAKWNGVNGWDGSSNTFSGGWQLRYVSGGGTTTTAWNGNLIGPGSWQVTFPITFGQAGSLLVFSRTVADARATVYGPGDGLQQSASTGDFNSGVRWEGIAEVRTTNGTVVTNYTVSSTSGFDYGAGVLPAPPQVTQINLVPGGVVLQWTDSFARSYTVETVPALTSTNWIPVAGVTWPITTNWTTLPVSIGTHGFFRLHAQ